MNKQPLYDLPENLDELEPERRVTVVCVTNQFQCDRIIKAGRVMADLSNTALNVISVANPGRDQDPAALQHLFDVTKENGGSMSILYELDPAKAIIRYLKENKTSYVLTGMPENENSILYQIWEKFTHITFLTVTPEGELQEAGRARSLQSAN